MPITLRLTTKAPPSAVREAVLHDAAYWREFRVPADLRARGAFGVSATIKGDTFTLWVDSLGRSPPPTYAILVGTVTSDEVEGSIVDARIGLPRTMRRFPLGLIALALLFWLQGVSRWPVPFFLLGAAALHARYRAWDHSITRASDEGARHLAERLEGAIDRLPPSNAVAARSLA